MQIAPAPRGQVIVIFTALLVVLLGFAALAIDVGRQLAERRHLQTAADAGALAGCSALIAGATSAAAAQQAREVGEANLHGSPAGTTPSIAPDNARVYRDGPPGDPAFLYSGILVSGQSVRVAVASEVQTTLGRVLGTTALDASARARCALQGGPALPIVARRYVNPPGPGSGFVDNLATIATSGSGRVDPGDVLGYDGRTPASENEPGPVFSLYGPNSKAHNESNFRGFIALDIRNFASTVSRSYYNGVPIATNANTIKDSQGLYIINGYPGPGFPPVTMPLDPNLQVAIMTGNDTPMVVGHFTQRYRVGDRILVAVYDGTVKQIPDFAILPPPEIALPSSTDGHAGPSFYVSRNSAFTSTVTLRLLGDEDAEAAGHPEYDILPEPPVNPPAAGHMNEPTWSTGGVAFQPATGTGTLVEMSNLATNQVPEGIYTVWLQGKSGDPYFQTRRQAVPVRIGSVNRQFSLANSTTFGSTDSLGGTITMPIHVSTGTGSEAWNLPGGLPATPVSLSVDSASFSTCTFASASIGPGQITLSQSSVVPTSGSGAVSNLQINTLGLGSGCYRFNLRATGINSNGQPVTRIEPITFTVATLASGGAYVDIIGFAVFKVTAISANSIDGQAVSPVVASADDPALTRAEQARLRPWTD
jgi:Flp pilus assembly protein TadG